MASGPPDEVLAWVAIHRLDALLSGELDEALRMDVGMTLAEHDALRQIDKAGGLLQMGDVARVLVLSKSGITRLIAKLEEDGLVERQVFPQDRRATFARLTDAGRERLCASEATFTRVLAESFGSHLTDHDVKQLSRILGKVLDAHGWCGAATCAEWAMEAADLPRSGA